MKIVRFICFTLLVSIMLIPFLWMLSSSFKTADEIFQIPVRWIPSQFFGENYEQAVTVFPFFRFFLNSIFVSALIIIGQLIFSIMAAYALARMTFRGKNTILFILLLGIMVPEQMIMIPVILQLNAFKLVNTYAGLTIPFMWSSLIVFFFVQFFKQIPNDLEDAGRIDGCSLWQMITKIIIPIAKPAIATAVIMISIYAWNMYLWPLLISSSEEIYTLQLGLSYFKSINELETNWGALMAASVLSLLPIFVIFISFQKYIINALTDMGVKG